MTSIIRNYVDYYLSGMTEEEYVAYLDANDLPYTQDHYDQLSGLQWFRRLFRPGI